MPVVGYLAGNSPDARMRSNADAVLRGLGETGYAEGKNLAIEYRWADGHFDRLPALAADLVRRKVDLIVAAGGTVPARAAKEATSTIPIVFTSAGDAVGDGLVGSLARPGGNLTGVSIITAEVTPKRLELLADLVDERGAIALLMNPTETGPIYGRIIAELQEGANARKRQFLVLTAGSESEIATAFTTLAQKHVGMVIVTSAAYFTSRREQIVALAARYSTPAIYAFRDFSAIGGLMSYGPSFADAYRQAGIYAGRILKGTKPSDLPVVQPTTFELAINMKTAKALDLTIPPSILARADEVIE